MYGIETIQRKSLVAKERLTEAARSVIFENADFENMTDDQARAMRALRAAIHQIDQIANHNYIGRLLNPR